jgi:methylglutaconyl-CoA hydratase
MKNWKNIQLNIEGNRANLVLNRPETHNALNPAFIEELHDALKEVSKMEHVNFLVLSGEGKSFCAGADINWFASAKEKSKADNWQEYLSMAELLKEIHQFPKITIAAAHRNVLGGGNGLLAACDFAIAEQATVFAFGEIRLGIVPATIAPFIAKRISVQNMKKLMYSGERFGAAEAHLIGLVDFVAEDGKLGEVVDQLIGGLDTSSPKALQVCKQLLLKIETGDVTIESSEYTAAVLADLVHTEEGQEGLKAFLEKRKPDWQKLNVVEN